MKYHSILPEPEGTDELFDSFFDNASLLPENKKQELSDYLSGRTNHMVDLSKLKLLLADLDNIKKYVSKNTSDGTCVDINFMKGIITVDFSFMEIDNPKAFWSLFKNTKLVELILIRENVIRISAEYDISVKI